MNTYTVDKAKELIIMSNPLWNKYISMCGVYQCEGGKIYLASEDGHTRFRIDDNFAGVVVADGIKDGDTLKTIILVRTKKQRMIRTSRLLTSPLTTVLSIYILHQRR